MLRYVQLAPSCRLKASEGFELKMELVGNKSRLNNTAQSCMLNLFVATSVNALRAPAVT